jgi:hypothetical protein
MAPKDEEDERHERIRLHAIRRLVAGAFQEWELAQQHECASTCAWIDDALVWQGRGYVIPILLSFSDFNCSPRVHLIKFRRRYGW